MRLLGVVSQLDADARGLGHDQEAVLYLNRGRRDIIREKYKSVVRSFPKVR